MTDRPKLTLIESLKQSVEEARQGEVVDLALERINRHGVNCKDVTVQQLLKVVTNDVERMENATKCYITVIQDTPEAFTVSNYRCGLDRQEEVSFRTLGVHEAMDNWRFGPIKNEE